MHLIFRFSLTYYYLFAMKHEKEPRRSPGVDPTQNKKLAVKMKFQLKGKSPEILSRTTRKASPAI